jgi:hypothetical protein
MTYTYTVYLNYQQYMKPILTTMKKQLNSIKPSAAERAAQSRKDKALNARLNNNNGVKFIGPMNKPKGFKSQNVPKNNSQSLTGRGSTRNPTKFSKSIVIEQDEYIGEVIGGATAANFNTTVYPVNIGQSGTFPWGSFVNERFEKYKFDMLEFYYKREVSEFATNGTTGKVMLSFDADASDPPPATKQQVEDTDPHVDCMPSENMTLRVPQKVLNKFTDGFYIRPAGLPGGNDIKTYDVGNLYVSTIALAGNSVTVGELHVRYRVHCFVPILESMTTAPANNSVSVWRSNAVNTAASGSNLQVLFATQDASGAGGVNTTGSIVMPPGNYLCDTSVNIYNTTGSGVLTVITTVQKNGATYNTTVHNLDSGFSAGGSNQGVMDVSNLFFSSNGTDIYTYVINATYGSGQAVIQGTVRFTAI